MAMSLQGGWKIGGRTQVGTLRQPRYFLPPRRVFSPGEPLKDPLLAPQNTCWRPTTPLRIFVNQTNSLMHTSTKPTAYSALFALLLLGLIATPAQAQLGIAAGANFDSVSDIQGSRNVQDVQKNSTGYHIGVVYDLGLGPVSLRPGLFYRKVGGYDFSDVPDADVDDLDVTAFEVPVDVRVTVFPFPLVSPYVVGGPNAFLPRSSEDDFDDDFEDISFTFNIGVGADVSLPGVGLTLQPEFRYEFGASDYISDDFEVAGLSPSDRSLSAYALRLNVLF